MKRFALLTTAALLLGGHAHAHTTTPARDANPASTRAIDDMFSWATPSTPGCSIAVSQHGKTVASRAYGLADLERGVPLSPDSVFDIGSVQKQFTAASILLLVEDGRLSLTDDIRTHIPELPDYGHVITIDHLLTHTAGIRDWTGMLPLAEGDPDVLKLIMRQRGLNFPPGDEWSYSTSGYELLKEIVVRRSGMSFADFTRTRLFEPLGMKSTSYHTDTNDLVRNRALAYEEAGDGWKLDMHSGNERGGGALMSTAGDLLVWNDALSSARLGAVVSEKLLEPATLNNGRKLTYARALSLGTHRGNRTISHTGGAAGYSAFLGRYPAGGISIAILCNVDEDSRRSYASRIIDLLAPPADGDGEPDRADSSRATTGTDVGDVDPRGRAGLFFNEKTGQPLRLAVDDGRLRVAGGPPLTALASDRFRNEDSAPFFMSGDEFEMHFKSNDAFELKSMEGATTRFRRARSWTPSTEELTAFEGRYESDELGSVLEIVPTDGGVVMRFHRDPDKALQLSPVDPDTFMFRNMTVRFVRSAEGRVVGYDYSNPVVRNIRFTRLSECERSQ